MEYLQQLPELNHIPPESAQAHLQKVLADPIFCVSDILKRFLAFIVQEMLEGRSNQLKEYTIGVNVLNKPHDFKPQTDAIVRIHATRLRRALNRYYAGAGNEDLLRISIPKGNYVPFFYEAGNSGFAELHHDEPDGGKNLSNKSLATVIAAVLPFSYFGKGENITSFAEGLASRLSAELGNTEHLSMIAYYPIRFLDKNSFPLLEIIQKTGAQYLFAGDIQHQENRIRVNFQMIKADSYEQVWFHLFERSLSSNQVFELQDEIVKEIIEGIEQYWNSKHTDIRKSSAMAVA
jgi:TolB-like protein